MKRRKTIGGKTFGELLENQEWKPSSTQLKDMKKVSKNPKKLGSMTKAERQKKHNDEVAKEIAAYRQGRKLIDELSASARSQLNRKDRNRRYYQNRKTEVIHSREMA